MLWAELKALLLRAEQIAPQATLEQAWNMAARTPVVAVPEPRQLTPAEEAELLAMLDRLAQGGAE